MDVLLKLHTVFITYNRLELTKQAIASYLETVSVPYMWTVVDNGSSDGTQDWLFENGYPLHACGENRYPGAAANIGWAYARPEVTHLHRADNDFSFLPGWCEEVEERFQDTTLGQLGMRTDEEEVSSRNVGGNCIIRRELWDAGLRYRERPWGKYPKGFSEDSYMSPEVERMGWRWERVKRPCIVNLASGDWSDEYYRVSYGQRRIDPHPDDPTVPEGFVPFRP